MTTSVRDDARIRDGDRGSVAVLFCFIVLIAGTLVTALVDAGTAIQAANRADTYSAEAARAASIAVGRSHPVAPRTLSWRRQRHARTWTRQVLRER